MRARPGPAALFLAPAYRWLSACGFDPMRALRMLGGFGGLVADFLEIARQNRRRREPCRLRFSHPCVDERAAAAGKVSTHYFAQDLWVARRVFERQPRRHVDVGSRVDGFVAHVAAFREIEVLDIRPLPGRIPNVVARQCDVTNLPDEWANCCDSLSCLHALEHFGLGRYGDTVDIDGHVKGFDGLCALLQRGGILYLSVPIGPERIEFNAHRVFAVGTVLRMADGRLNLSDFSFIDDWNEFHAQALLDRKAVDANCGCRYGCGIFEFRKG